MNRIILSFILSVAILSRCSIQRQVDYNRWRLIRITTLNSIRTFEDFRNAIGRSTFLKIIDERKGQMDVAVNPLLEQKELEKLIDEFNFSYQILHTNIGRLLEENEGRKKRSIDVGDVFNRYMNLNEMESYIFYLENTYPRYVKKEIIGKSFEGRNIYMFTIRSNLSTKQCQSSYNKDQDLINLNKLERLVKLSPYFGMLTSRSNRNTKEIPLSIIKRVQNVANKTHSFLFFDIASFNRDITTHKKDEKPLIFLDGGTHAREWITPAACLYLIKHLAENPKLTEKIDWKIIPMANPDGYVYSWESDRFWRKTRSTTIHPNCNGADMNRNFGHHWGEVDTSNFPCYEHYGGPFEFSEIETVAIRDQMLKEKHRLKAYISVHNWGQEIVYPYSYSRDKLPVTDDELKRVSNGMVRYISDVQKIPYKSGIASLVLYPASGTSMDWAYDTLGVSLSYLFELRDSNGILGFSLPETLIQPTSEDLVAAMTYLATVVEQNVTCS